MWFPTPRLLGGTLYPLGTRRNVIVILVHATGGTVGTGLGRLAAVDTLELEVLDHGIGGRLGTLDTGRKNLLEEVEVLELVLLGELDVELDVQVTEVVVTEGRHTLARDNLNGI